MTSYKRLTTCNLLYPTAKMAPTSARPHNMILHSWNKDTINAIISQAAGHPVILSTPIMQLYNTAAAILIAFVTCGSVLHTAMNSLLTSGVSRTAGLRESLHIVSASPTHKLFIQSSELLVTVLIPTPVV